MKRHVERSRAPLHHGALCFRGEESPLNVFGGSVATDAANEILCDVLTAIKAGPKNDSAVRLLSRLVSTHEWVLRIAELHEYLDRLVRSRTHDRVIDRIINDPQNRGRRHEHKAFVVHLMRATIATEGCSAARAAELVEERHGRALNLCAASIKADYSRHQHEYDRLRAGQFIGAKWLASQSWQRE